MKKTRPSRAISPRRLKALIIKEFYQIVRDPSSILITIVLPAILLFLYGYGVSLDADHLKIGLVLEDTAPDAQSFAKSLTNSHYFDVKIARDRREFDQEIVEGTLRGIVIVPSYFSEFRSRPATVAPIQVIADGSEPNTANFVQNYVHGAYQNWLKQEAISSDLINEDLLINIQSRYWFNEELDSTNFLVPGSLAIIMTLIGTLLTSLVVAREWERGTMEALMATPVGIFELMLGKLIPYFILGIGSMILSVLIAIILFHVPFRASWLALGLTSAVFLFTALGLGLMISTLSKNQFIASQAALISGFLPAFILSGFIFEISSMPLPIRILTYIIPARYFVSCLLTLFLVGNVWKLLIHNMILIILIGAIFFAITARVTVKRLD